MSHRHLAALFTLLVMIGALPVVNGYREGPPLESKQSTHQFLFDHAVALIETDGHGAVADWIRGAFLEEMKRGTIRADQTLLDSREHYHDPWSHEGLAGFRSAANLSKDQYALALERWTLGDRLGAGFHLGWAAHMVQDLTVPHHARLTPLDYHAEYEAFVLANQAEAIASSGGVYAFDTKLSGHYDNESDPWDWVDYNAHRSYDRFAEVSSGDAEGFRSAMNDLMPLAQRTTAGFLLSFFQVVNLPPEVAIVGPATATPGSSFSLFARVDEDIAVLDTTWILDGRVVGRGRDVGLSFPSQGDHLVEVVVIDALGVTVRASHFLQITASQSLTLTILGPSAVERGTVASFEVETPTSIGDYDWYVDDVWVGSEPQLMMRFDHEGVVRIEVHVRMADERTAKGARVLRVEDLTPLVVSLPESFRVPTGQTFSIAAGDYVAGEDVASVVWIVDEEWRGGSVVTLRFEEASTHALTLLVSDSAGNVAAGTSLILVEGSSPVQLIASVPTRTVLLLVVLTVGVLAAAVVWRHRRRRLQHRS